MSEPNNIRTTSQSPQLPPNYQRSSSPIRRREDELFTKSYTKNDDDRSFSSRSNRTHTPPDHLNHHPNHRSRDEGSGYHKRGHYHHNGQNRWNNNHHAGGGNFGKFNK
jgi:hypothetical protein